MEGDDERKDKKARRMSDGLFLFGGLSGRGLRLHSNSPAAGEPICEIAFENSAATRAEVGYDRPITIGDPALESSSSDVQSRRDVGYGQDMRHGAPVDFIEAPLF